jgi:hypothetical protein
MNQTPDQLQADLMADTVAFPVLSAAELAECTEFGTRCSFAPGEEIFGAGSQSFDCYVIVSGDVCIMDVCELLTSQALCPALSRLLPSYSVQ